jgi:hypothetical protein
MEQLERAKADAPLDGNQASSSAVEATGSGHGKNKFGHDFDDLPIRPLLAKKQGPKYTPDGRPIVPTDDIAIGEGEGGRGQSVPLSAYEKLKAEISSQELLLAGFQRENERLLKELKSREAEDAARKAKFFDQQESMNKELNRLRNAVGELPAGYAASFDGQPVTNNATAQDAGPRMSAGAVYSSHVGIGYIRTSTNAGTGIGAGISGGVTASTSSGGGGLARKSADALRTELDYDTAIRALKEQVAIAEAGAGVREKELHQVSASL